MAWLPKLIEKASAMIGVPNRIIFMETPCAEWQRFLAMRLVPLQSQSQSWLDYAEHPRQSSSEDSVKAPHCSLSKLQIG
jgi:hypothetical protein